MVVSTLNMYRFFSCHFLNKTTIYIVLDIINDQEMISSIWEDVSRLYDKTMPFYIRD